MKVWTLVYILFLILGIESLSLQIVDKDDDSGMNDISGLEYIVMKEGKDIHKGHFNSKGLAQLDSNLPTNFTIVVGGIHYEWTAVDVNNKDDDITISVAVQKRQFYIAAQSPLEIVWAYITKRPLLTGVSLVVILVALLPAILIKLDPDFADRVAQNAMKEKEQ